MTKWRLIISIILTTIIIVVPRFFQLGETPHGLHIDEVSFAADAKSLAETGKDTWGVPMPRVFKAFGEYKAPGLTYSMAFWSLLTGTMNNFVARLPSALAGLTTIIMLVLTLRTLIPSISPYLLLSMAIILAYSPWHFDMSRIFYEAFSALAFLSISLYFAIRSLMQVKNRSRYEWLLTLIMAALAGYYYASLRYIIIAFTIILAALAGGNYYQIFKRMALYLVVIMAVGSLWLGDLFSDIGLNRLHYYQQKASYGAGLEIDEKRQYCYLALNKDALLAKGCYALWNKPVDRLTGAAHTVLTYLGTDFLFLKGESEYGFDSEYGAFLPPIILLYLIGLYQLLSSFITGLTKIFKRHKPTPFEQVAILLVSLICLSLVPAALAQNVNMRMSLVSLYGVALILGLGLSQLSDYLRTHATPLIRSLFYLLFGGTLLFYMVQSTIHYWFVFTKSNDLQWTSDAGPIFNYVKSVSPQYDRIVDTELHGPLAPYFYGDITTAEVHAGEYSEPDAIGFTYLIKAGKYELKHINIKDLACEVVSNKDTRRTLVISNPYPELLSMRKYESRSWNGALLLHEVYDLADVIAFMERSEPNFRSRCSPK